MENIGIVGVAAITAICYFAAEVVKATKLNNKWIPAICGSLGAVLGIVSMYIMPDFPAGDMITAISVGIVSGFAATGVNQMYKQMTLDN